jgi:hypothetical protein
MALSKSCVGPIESKSCVGDERKKRPAVPGRYSPFRFFVAERAPRPRVVAAHLLPSLLARVPRRSPSLLSLQWHQLVTGFSLHLFYFFSANLFLLLSLDFEALFFWSVLHVLFGRCCFFVLLLLSSYFFCGR